MLNEKKGITLIALVVTIIILVLLAVVAITVAIGPNSIIQRAQNSDDTKRIGEIEDRITIRYNNNLIRAEGGLELESLESFLQKLLTEGYITEEEQQEGLTNGTITIGNKVINILEVAASSEGENPPLPTPIDISLVNIGDIIYYDPTAGVSSPTTNPILQYTSPKGSSKADGAANNEHGNGQQDQTFQATSSDCKWVVLYKKDNQLVLMSYDLKNPTEETAYNGIFGMYGATGYFYAEQELHNICSIYGHRERCSK